MVRMFETVRRGDLPSLRCLMLDKASQKKLRSSNTRVDNNHGRQIHTWITITDVKYTRG